MHARAGVCVCDKVFVAPWSPWIEFGWLDGGSFYSKPDIVTFGKYDKGNHAWKWDELECPRLGLPKVDVTMLS